MSVGHTVALVGAGVIADTHAAVLKATPTVSLVGVVDANRAAAKALAEKYNLPHCAASLPELSAKVAFRAVHVLTPPATHFAIATEALDLGYHVFLEKPLATSSIEAEALVAHAARLSLHLGVNQNFLFNKSFIALRQALTSKQYGVPVQILCHFSMPLRQMDAGQFGHWMFNCPLNILLEQAIHPLSQLLALSGPIDTVKAAAGPPHMIGGDHPFYNQWQISLQGADVPAHLSMSLGLSLPVWRVSLVCSDGVISADMIRDRVQLEQRSRWPDFADHYLEARSSIKQLSRQAFGNARDYILSTLKLRPRSDPFFVGMTGSIQAFHAALAANTAPAVDGRFGAALVALAERITAAAAVPESVPPLDTTDVVSDTTISADIALLGGTGFIGSAVLAYLLAGGHTVTVMARSLGNLPQVFHHPNVRLQRGDVTNKDHVARAVGGVKWVVNLAHGGGGDSWAEVERRMVDSACLVAEQAQRAGVKRLLHISSIAALYLGDPEQSITGATPTDPRAGERADYARGKALAEEKLRQFAERHALEVCILRPGVVVGQEGIALHSAFGFYNNDGHCIGWNAGDNPLPFVLVDDVATAICSALTAPKAAGKSYNLVGDVTPSARTYLAKLAAATGRPIGYHPQTVTGLQMVEIGKWVIKRLIGRRVPFPSYRDLKSRGLVAPFDCSDTKSDLSWQPEARTDQFYAKALPAPRAGIGNAPTPPVSVSHDDLSSPTRAAGTGA